MMHEVIVTVFWNLLPSVFARIQEVGSTEKKVVTRNTVTGDKVSLTREDSECAFDLSVHYSQGFCEEHIYCIPNLQYKAPCDTSNR